MKDLDEIEMLLDSEEEIREMIEEGIIEFYDYLHQRPVTGTKRFSYENLENDID